MQFLIVENMEPCLSPWLLAEYRYVAEIFGERLIITNVKDENMLRSLRTLAKATPTSLANFIKEHGISPRNIIVLDPSAPKELKAEEIQSAEAVVIGGIMGDYPPRGRTRELITSKIPEAMARNLGKYQLTIAGTAYILREVEKGRPLNQLDIRYGLTHELRLNDITLVIDLPYAFPFEDGKPVLPTDYLSIIGERSVYYEAYEACNEHASRPPPPGRRP